MHLLRYWPASNGFDQGPAQEWNRTCRTCAVPLTHVQNWKECGRTERGGPLLQGVCGFEGSVLSRPVSLLPGKGVGMAVGVSVGVLFSASDAAAGARYAPGDF